MVEIVPAIIPKQFEDIKEKAELVSPYVRSVQVDIMDGMFAPEPSYPFVLGDTHALKENVAKKVRVSFELDMMVEHPEAYIDEWEVFGVSTFIIHFESTEKHQELIDYIRAKDKGVAFAFKPSLDTKKLEPFIKQLDFIQCMGNDKIGYHGVELDENVFSIIGGLRERHPHSIISVDIGVNIDTAHKLKKSGASKLVSGSAIFDSGNVQEAIQRLTLA